MQLLDLYRSRFGNAVKRQGNGWNGPCPLCGGEPGKSDRFMVWPERDEGLGEACAEHGIKGIWSCRQCGASGDTIAYLMKADGLDFKAALAELGIDGGRPSHRRRRAPQEPQREDAAFQPREWPTPSDAWREYAEKLVAEAQERIWQEEAALRWLAARGIDDGAVRAYRIGYLPPEGGKYPGRWRARTALGLAPKTGEDGRARTKIFIPRGIVIPTLGIDGRVLNIRIRRHREDLRERSPKYMELEGSSHAPMLLRAPGPSALAAYFVVEAELDAVLIHHATGGAVGTLAVRTNRGKPDVAAHARLKDAVLVGVALDYDQAGAEGVAFWERTYPKSLRWPTPEGKDPGDAFKLGVDIREWVAAALPPSVSLPSGPHGASISCTEATAQDDSQNGQADTLLPGTLEMGGGGRLKTATGEEKEGGRPDSCQAWPGRPVDWLTTPAGPQDSLRVLARAGLRVERTSCNGEDDFVYVGHGWWRTEDQMRLMAWSRRWGHFVRMALYPEQQS